MSPRLISAALGAAMLLTGARALADESTRNAAPQKVPACCERVASQLGEHRAAADAKRAKDVTTQTAQKPAFPPDEDWFSRPPYTGP